MNFSFHLQRTNDKTSKLEETWMKTTLSDEPDEWQSRYVARGGEGVQEEHPVDIVPSPGVKDGRNPFLHSVAPAPTHLRIQ